MPAKKSATRPKRATGRAQVKGLTGQVTLTSTVEILNISLGGVSVRANCRVSPGSLCTLKLHQGQEHIAVNAGVIWSSLTGFRKSGEDSVPEYSVGMKFKDVISDEGRSIVRFINQHKAFKDKRLSGLRVEVPARVRAVLDQVCVFDVKVLSRTGMSIEMGRELDVSRTYSMELRVDERRSLHVSGKIASHLEATPQRHEIHVEFAQLSAAAQKLLQSLLRSQSRKAKK